MASSHKILSIIGPKRKDFPTYVSMLMTSLFSAGPLGNLMEFLHVYGSISRWMNHSKKVFLTTNESISFYNYIYSILGCHRGSIPFNFLSRYFSGGHKRRFFQSLADRS